MVAYYTGRMIVAELVLEVFPSVGKVYKALVMLVKLPKIDKSRRK
jgi:hypothetical protein